jgi:MoaA/NifB/PqqE/SkfB family radical SAM enzyme
MEISPEVEQTRGSGTLMLHLLGRCNLQCLHCYMEGSPSRREKLPAESVLEAIGECEILGVGGIYLTGGEPLLYPAIREVITVASQVPGLQITLCTNGTLVKNHHVTFLKDRNVHVNVSIDGEEKFHDEFRQLPGAFRLSERAIRAMAEAGIPVTIVTTISQQNLHALPGLVAWAANVGARKYRVQPLLKLGRGERIAGQRLSVGQMNMMVLQLSDLANRYRSMGLTCSLIGVSRRFLFAHPCGAYVCNGAGCHRRVAKEIKKLVVREDGTVLPEVTNLNHRYALGKIGDGPLSSMVNRYFDDGGYQRFDRLCRALYAEVLPAWESEVVPWDQIVAEHSHTFSDRPFDDESGDRLPAFGCGDHAELIPLSSLN